MGKSKVFKLRILNFSNVTQSNVTIYARNATFAFNWLLLAVIFAGQTFSRSDDRSRLTSTFHRLFHKLLNGQSAGHNLNFLLRCSWKFVLILSGLIYNTYGKYNWRMKRNISAWEKLLIIPFP